MIKKKFLARCWWLTPVILATWEAEIGRITVPIPLLNGKKLSMVVHACHPNNGEKPKIGGF
jgi:hypothetical protein